MEKKWHGYVGWDLNAKDGDYCGHVGRAYPCDSYDDGIAKALDYLRDGITLDSFLVHSFIIKVEYF